MNQLNISILIIVLILVLSYVNWQLGYHKPATPVNNNNNNNIINNRRYTQALKEHFAVDTKQLENDIKTLNSRKNPKQMNNAIKNQIASAIAENIQEEEEAALYEASNDVNSPSFNNIISAKSDSIDEMISKLDNVEEYCKKIELEQKAKDDMEQIQINKSALKELENQDRKIEELAQVVKTMRQQKMKRDIISNKCRTNKQKILDKNYETVKALSNKGFLKDTSRRVNVNVPEEGIKVDFDIPQLNKIYQESASKDRVKGAPRNIKRFQKNYCPEHTGVSLSKLNNGVCHKCNPNKLRGKMNQITRDFSN